MRLCITEILGVSVILSHVCFSNMGYICHPKTGGYILHSSAFRTQCSAFIGVLYAYKLFMILVLRVSFKYVCVHTTGASLPYVFVQGDNCIPEIRYLMWTLSRYRGSVLPQLSKKVFLSE